MSSRAKWEEMSPVSAVKGTTVVGKKEEKKPPPKTLEEYTKELKEVVKEDKH
jgi:hypothetical protein